ncbi:hypothetical protein ACLKA7_001125 [Drosophila subpalustris]
MNRVSQRSNKGKPPKRLGFEPEMSNSEDEMDNTMVENNMAEELQAKLQELEERYIESQKENRQLQSTLRLLTSQVKEQSQAEVSTSADQSRVAENYLGTAQGHITTLPPNNNHNDKRSQQKHVLYTVNDKQENAKKCIICNDDHKLYKCETFSKKKLPEKWEIVKKNRLCFGCLRQGHSVQNCSFRRECKIDSCQKFHNRILHDSQKKKPIAENDKQLSETENNSLNTTLINEKLPQTTLFKYVPIKVFGPKGHCEVIAFIDEGSTISLIEEEIADSLGLKGAKSHMTLKWIGDKSTTEMSQQINLEIQGSPSELCHMKNVRTVKKLMLPSQDLNLLEFRKCFSALNNLPIDEYNSATPKMLIGMPHVNLLHIFVDASEEAYAAVAYWRITHHNEVSIEFVMGKANCSPIKALSVPRLELHAAVLGVRLKNAVLANHQVYPKEVHLWSDSKTVINWIHSDSRRYKQYVAHRVSEILESTNVAEWKWIPGTKNPADVATRMSSKVDPAIWINGPSFLRSDICEWPEQPKDLKKHDQTDEQRQRFVYFATENTIFDLINKFSKYEKLLRVLCWVRRAIDLFKNRSSAMKKSKTLTALEIRDVVIICDENESRGQWKKGRIISVQTARDGQVRTATVKTETGVLRRPASKLAVLDVVGESQPLP